MEQVDTSYLESLLGYNARRAALSVIEVFMVRMAPYGLRPVDFSVLSLITHNPGITSRQLCTALGIQPPNLVAMVNSLEKRELVEQNARAALETADYAYVLEMGEIAFEGPASELAHDPRVIGTYLGAASVQR